MTAIAFPMPEEIEALADGVERFLKAEVFPRHDYGTVLPFRRVFVIAYH